jgi:hypothetical protein
MTKSNFAVSKLALYTLLCTLSFLTLARAQDDADDPPTRVARVSYLRGSVSFEPAGTQDWVDATVNRPMTTGDQLWSDRGSRAALHIGSASIVLSENTGFSFLNLTDSVAQIQLSTGTLRIRVKRLGENENFEVDTPNLAFSILRPGIYKISVNEAGDTTVIKDRAGEGEVTGGGAAYTVHAGELDTFTGTDQLNAEMDSISDDDDEFEQWCQQRDHHEDNSISRRYVSDDAIGYDDLDDNGGWRSVPEYGNVWFPHTVVVGWAPYHYGHWSYIAPWGYTWVDDAPWGFAPFHYGRWVFVNGGWGWVPCPPRPPQPAVVYVRPVYAPALVAWLDVGSASLAWFALGPREVFVPAYPVSRNYVTNINVSNTTVNTTVVNNYYNTVIVNKTVNVTNVTYVNQRVAGAVAATTPRALSSGQPVGKNFVAVNNAQVASARVVATTPPTVPEREAVLGGRPAATAKPPVAVQARPVVAKTPPPPRPPMFTQRQAAIQANGGHPLSVAQVRQITPPHTQATVAPVKIAPPPKSAPMQPAPKAGAQNQPDRRPSPPAASNAPQNEHPPAPAAPNNRPTPPPSANNSAPRPPTAHPQDEQTEQKHQQEIEDLHNRQDQERRQLEQQQQQERQKQQQEQAQKLQQQQANEAKQKAVEEQQRQAEQLAQQHQRQLVELEQKHQQEQQQMQQKQAQEHAAPAKPQPEKPQPPKEHPPAKPQ